MAAWIGAAYWFTASTSFANPAAVWAHALGYVCRNRAGGCAGFVIAEIAAAGALGVLGLRLFRRPGVKGSNIGQ